MLLQVVVALIAAGGVVVFALRRKIKALFKKDGGKTAAPKPSDGDSGEIVDMMDEQSSEDGNIIDSGENDGKE
jgi:hypothetical protein